MSSKTEKMTSFAQKQCKIVVAGLKYVERCKSGRFMTTNLGASFSPPNLIRTRHQTSPNVQFFSAYRLRPFVQKPRFLSGKAPYIVSKSTNFIRTGTIHLALFSGVLPEVGPGRPPRNSIVLYTCTSTGISGPGTINDRVFFATSIETLSAAPSTR